MDISAEDLGYKFSQDHRPQSFSLTKEVLSNYPNSTFLETGTAYGGGVRVALECGFKRIISIEIREDLHAAANSIFKDHKEVELYLGSSIDMLGGIIDNITTNITFWLDAHTIGKDTPILRELAIINRHPVKRHAILIDDRRMMKPGKWDIAEQEVMNALLTINPNYVISHEWSPMDAADIITAKPPPSTPLDLCPPRAVRKYFRGMKSGRK